MIDRKKLSLCSAGLIALLLAACTAGGSATGTPPAPTAAPGETPTASPPTATEPAATPAGEDTPPENAAGEADAAAIYAAVVRQLYEVDNSFEQPPNWPYLYILSETDDSITGLGEVGPSESIPPAAQAAIAEQLADLPAEIIWAQSWDDVPIEEEGGAVREGDGAIITLGNIHPTDEADRVEVPSGLYCGGLCGTGMTYIVERQGDTWVVTGVTGPVWIS
jgi:hypothetical protein